MTTTFAKTQFKPTKPTNAFTWTQAHKHTSIQEHNNTITLKHTSAHAHKHTRTHAHKHANMRVKQRQPKLPQTQKYKANRGKKQ